MGKLWLNVRARSHAAQKSKSFSADKSQDRPGCALPDERIKRVVDEPQTRRNRQTAVRALWPAARRRVTSAPRVPGRKCSSLRSFEPGK